MLQAGALAGAGDARQHLEPAIDLQCVGRHRHRVLAVFGAQALGQRHRHGGLADAGGTEQRKDL